MTQFFEPQNLFAGLHSLPTRAAFSWMVHDALSAAPSPPLLSINRSNTASSSGMDSASSSLVEVANPDPLTLGVFSDDVKSGDQAEALTFRSSRLMYTRMKQVRFDKSMMQKSSRSECAKSPPYPTTCAPMEERVRFDKEICGPKVSRCPFPHWFVCRSQSLVDMTDYQHALGELDAAEMGKDTSVFVKAVVGHGLLVIILPAFQPDSVYFRQQRDASEAVEDAGAPTEPANLESLTLTPGAAAGAEGDAAAAGAKSESTDHGTAAAKGGSGAGGAGGGAGGGCGGGGGGGGGGRRGCVSSSFTVTAYPLTRLDIDPTDDTRFPHRIDKLFAPHR
jgi:uncharacterized membrane protein YgcG